MHQISQLIDQLVSLVEILRFVQQALLIRLVEHVQVRLDLAAVPDLDTGRLFSGRIFVLKPFNHLTDDKTDRSDYNKEYKFKKYHCARQFIDLLHHPDPVIAINLEKTVVGYNAGLFKISVQLRPVLLTAGNPPGTDRTGYYLRGIFPVWPCQNNHYLL